ncbi:hypothetical protein AB0H32_35760, partial [Streptomyces sp. NPDC020362]
ECARADGYSSAPVRRPPPAGPWWPVAQFLVNASRDASLAVVGRRIRTSSLGAHIGHVTHAALHHITAPVAVVAHV